VKNGIGQAAGLAETREWCKKHGRRLIRSNEGLICVECVERKAGGRNDNPEHRAQCAVIAWRDQAVIKWPELRLLHAIPNGGKRDVATARKLRAEGVVAGIPDLCLPVARKGYHGLYIEMKAGDKQVTPIQREVGELLEGQGYMVAVCNSADLAICRIEEYLGGV